MSSRRFILPLLWFNLRQLPTAVWYLLSILLLQAVFFSIVNIELDEKLWGTTSLNNSLNLVPILFCCIIGIQFMVSGGVTHGSALLLPTAEFFLARAIPRSTAYFTRTSIVFMAMLIIPLLSFGFALSKPDLRLSLYHSKAQSTEAFDQLALLQVQFPDSQVASASKSSTVVLVVPHGFLLIAAWQLWIVFMLAMLIQAAALLALPFKKPLYILTVVCLAPILLTVLLDSVGKNSGIMENAFFLFVHYWVAFVVIAFGLFSFLQRLALRRIRDLEVI